MFEPVWSPAWAEIAPKWVRVGAKLGRSWSQTWPKLTPTTRCYCHVVPICQMRNYHSEEPTFGAANMAPPPLKPYQPNKCVRNLKSHVSAPSVRADLKDPSTVLNWLRTGICLPSYKWCVCIYIHIYPRNFGFICRVENRISI